MKKAAGANPLPIRLIMLATGLALALITALGWYVWNSVQVLKTVQQNTFSLLELTGDIRYLNEDLWISARLRTTSGEERWAAQYREQTTRRGEAFARFQELDPKLYSSPEAVALIKASNRMAAIEARALDSTTPGEYSPDAAALLTTAEYLQQQQIAAKATNGLVEKLRRRTDEALEDQRSSGKLVIVAAALAVFLLLFTWVVSLRISATLIARRRREEVERTEQGRRAAFVADVRGALTKGANLKNVVEAMVQHLDAAFARIWILNPEDNTLILQASAGLDPGAGGASEPIPLGLFKIGRIAQDRKPHLTNDLTSDTAAMDRDWVWKMGLTAFAGYPLIVEDRLIGVMAMFARAPLSEVTLSALGSVADTIAQGVQREHAEALTRRYAQDLVQANTRLEVQAAKLARTAEELALARDAALESARLKSQFLANMSHEIRTPMTGIIGMTNLAIDTQLTSEQRDYLGMVRSSADYLLNLINDILDFSKIEAGKLDFERLPFSLRDAIEESVRPLLQRGSEKGLRLSTRIAPEVPDGLVGDPSRLRQILVNLVGNAIKFTERGEVAVSVVVERKHDDHVVLQVAVSDTGIGIPRDKRAVIFQPFVQADGSTTRKHGGTGLGLAICQHLVRLMGGSIWVEGEVGIGSTFTFSVPFEYQEAATGLTGLLDGVHALDGALATNSRRGLRILMAEDNTVNQTLVARLLEKRGHSVVAVSNGLEAIEALEREAFDVILMDLQMPAMGGLEATAAIRRREREAPYPSGTHVPIVAMTASAMKGDRERCLEAGMDGYVSKPIDHALLFEAVETAAKMTRVDATSA